MCALSVTLHALHSHVHPMIKALRQQRNRIVCKATARINEGGFSDDAWLDVKDNKLVLLNDYSVAIAHVEDEQLKNLKRAFLSEASHAELLSQIRANQLKKVVLANITALHSRHDENLILLAEGEKEHNLTFLNTHAKAHALDKLEAKLPATLERRQHFRSRLRSAMPRLVALVLLVGAGYYSSSAFTWFVIGFSSMVFIVPALIQRLISPTVVTTYALMSAMPERNKTNKSKRRRFAWRESVLTTSECYRECDTAK